MSFKLRIPGHWSGRLHSATVRQWVEQWLRSKTELPADPGGGEARVSLLLADGLLTALEAETGDVASVALRRVIASYITSSLTCRMHASTRSGASTRVSCAVNDRTGIKTRSEASGRVSDIYVLWWPEWVVFLGLAAFGWWLWKRFASSGDSSTGSFAEAEPVSFQAWVPKGE